MSRKTRRMKSLVTADLGGEDPELVQLGVHQWVVDVVESRGRSGLLVGEHLGRDDDGLGALGEGVEAGEEEGLAARSSIWPAPVPSSTPAETLVVVRGA